MLERFSGDEGRRLLIEALNRQSIVGAQGSLAETLAGACELEEIPAGTVLIQQHASDNDLFFILMGSLSIVVNGREVAQRRAQQHVGEMALIDPKARRAASAIAREDSVVARISEPAFSEIARRDPTLWRNIACELGDRLRQRNEFVRQRNELPHVFIGSSKESLDVANAVQAGLARDPFMVAVWTNGVFGPSQFAIEALERVASESDFAVLVLAPDDVVISRAEENPAPRDNVILELGLFIGVLGRPRVFLLVPDGIDVKIPSDVLGVTPVKYSIDDNMDIGSRVQAPCDELRESIERQGPR